MNTPQSSFLFITQVYVPDPAAVGQHMADAAAQMARRGHAVTVLTADRGYDNPRERFPARETLDGVEVRRLPWSSFGKRSIPVRLLGGASFVAQAVLRGLLLPRVDAVVVSTSPPLAPLAALALSFLRGAPIKYWVMDLNPDQAVALGVVKPGSLAARAFEALNRAVLARAKTVVVLDRFMAERVTRKRDVRGKMVVIPPWPLDDDLRPVPHADNPFRRRHGLEGKRVIMYSGNHSPANPVTTALEAARRLAARKDLAFVFVGGGAGKREVDRCGLPNVLSLPYQPLAELKYSLSAADAHLVSVGDGIVGICHPCKVYGAMSVARPVFLLGPEPCHVSELIARADIGWHVRHGDADAAERAALEVADLPQAELSAKGERARALIGDGLSKSVLCGKFCGVLETT